MPRIGDLYQIVTEWSLKHTYPIDIGLGLIVGCSDNGSWEVFNPKFGKRKISNFSLIEKVNK